MPFGLRISELQPRVIVDIGSWAGGSALFFADFATMLAPERFEKVAPWSAQLVALGCPGEPRRDLEEPQRGGPKGRFEAQEVRQGSTRRSSSMPPGKSRVSSPRSGGALGMQHRRLQGALH